MWSSTVAGYPPELDHLARRLHHAGEGLSGIWVETGLREVGIKDSRSTFGGAGRVVLRNIAGAGRLVG